MTLQHSSNQDRSDKPCNSTALPHFQRNIRNVHKISQDCKESVQASSLGHLHLRLLCFVGLPRYHATRHRARRNQWQQPAEIRMLFQWNILNVPTHHCANNMPAWIYLANKIVWFRYAHTFASQKWLLPQPDADHQAPLRFNTCSLVTLHPKLTSFLSGRKGHALNLPTRECALVEPKAW